MAVTMTFTTTIKNDDGVLQATAALIASGDAVESFSVVSPASDNVVVPFTVDISSVTAFWFVSDQAVTMEENAAVDFTVALVANVPYFWIKDAASGFTDTNPMGVTDIVTLKFTNAGGTNANVKGGFLTT